MSPGKWLPILLWALAAGPASAGALELPFEARLEPVIEDGEIEGQPVQVARFTSRLGAAELERVLRREWRGPQGAELVQARIPGWRVLSAWSPEGFRTLQFRPRLDGGSEGVLSVWPSGTAGTATTAGVLRAAQAPALPGAELLPAGSTVLRRFSAVDAGRRGQTVVAVAEASPSWLADAIGQRLVAQGFAPDPVMQTRGGRGEGRRFRRADAEVVFTVSAAGQGRSGVVLHAIGAAP